MASTEERVITIVAEQVNRPVEQVTRECSFTADLAYDSLDLVELTMNLEDEFGVTIADTDRDKIQTVGQAIDYVKERV